MVETTPPTQNYNNSVVRIYQGNKVIGSGFLIEGGYVLTCAHVVRDALGEHKAKQPLGAVVKLQFPLLNPKSRKKLSAKVLVYQLQGEQLDVAGLQIIDALPGSACPMGLGLKHNWNDPFSAYGFPEGYPAGLWSEGFIKGECARENSSSWVQIQGETEQGYGIRPGFSGSPIWNHHEAAIVGMTVRRDAAEPDSKIAFMIPARSLLKVQKTLERLSLLELLKPHQESLEASVHHAYQLCCPSGWIKPLPDTLDQFLEALQEMSDKQGYTAIARFVALLALPDLNPHSDLRQQLQEWLEKRVTDLAPLMDWARSLLAPKQAQTATSQDSHLLIYVHGDESAEDKSVLALFLPDAKKFDSRTGAGCGPVNAPGAKPFNAKVTLETLPQLVRACIKEVSPKSQNLLIHLMLPLTWLTQGCDRWPLIERAKLPAVLAKALPPEMRIGAQHRLVVRISDRLNPELYCHFEEVWREKWTALQPLEPSKVGEAFARADGLCFHNELMEQLQEPHQLGVRFSTVCDESQYLDLFGTLIATGTPVALWLRQDKGEFVESVVAEDEIDTLLKRKVASLPEAVKHCRSHAIGKPEDSHIGHHLALLWADPDLIPPSANPYSQLAMPEAS